MLDAEGAGGLLGEGVAVALAVGGAHEGGDDVHRPLADLLGLAPSGTVAISGLDPSFISRIAPDAAKSVGEVIAVQVIPRPHDGLSGLGKWLQ